MTFYYLSLFYYDLYSIDNYGDIISGGAERTFNYYSGTISFDILAPVLALDMVWTVSDILNAFMAVPNLIAVLLLSSQIAKDTAFYIDNIDHHHEEELYVVDK